MSDGTKIEWTDATWNVINGCSVTSPGCTNCYAMRLAGTRLRNHPSRVGLTRPSKAGPVWTGETRFNDKVLLDPLRWRRPRRVFVCAHGDLFHESVSEEWIDRVFAIMAICPEHQFQVLTKRAERMRAYCNSRFGTEAGSDALSEAIDDLGQGVDPTDWDAPLPNVWLGVSAEDQQRADERIPHLLATPAAVRWVSAEPLLGPIDFANIGTMLFRGCEGVNALTGAGLDIFGVGVRMLPKLNWVVAGGESGPGARPMQADWARSLRDQCQDLDVAFLFKQWGNFAPTSDCNGPYMMPCSKKAAGRHLDGQLHDAFPA